MPKSEKWVCNTALKKWNFNKHLLTKKWIRLDLECQMNHLKRSFISGPMHYIPFSHWNWAFWSRAHARAHALLTVFSLETSKGPWGPCFLENFFRSALWRSLSCLSDERFKKRQNRTKVKGQTSQIWLFLNIFENKRKKSFILTVEYQNLLSVTQKKKKSSLSLQDEHSKIKKDQLLFYRY